MNHEFTPIARIRSPFKQKFAIPRQPGLVPGAIGEVVFLDGFNDIDLLRQLEQFSHLWLLFLFHASADQGWSPTVQPPRLGGRRRVGVFASRSPFRPNPIGISVVTNLGHEQRDGSLVLRVGGIDLLDGTPLVDIKPYLPYADAVADAHGGYADQAPGTARVVGFTEQAQAQLQIQADRYPGLESFITDVLRQDPRPAWRVSADDDKQYGMTLYDLNIKWRLQADSILVTEIREPLSGEYFTDEDPGKRPGVPDA